MKPWSQHLALLRSSRRLLAYLIPCSSHFATEVHGAIPSGCSLAWALVLVRNAERWP